MNIDNFCEVIKTIIKNKKKQKPSWDWRESLVKDMLTIASRWDKKEFLMATSDKTAEDYQDYTKLAKCLIPELMTVYTNKEILTAKYKKNQINDLFNSDPFMIDLFAAHVKYLNRLMRQVDNIVIEKIHNKPSLLNDSIPPESLVPFVEEEIDNFLDKGALQIPIQNRDNWENFLEKVLFENISDKLLREGELSHHKKLAAQIINAIKSSKSEQQLLAQLKEINIMRYMLEPSYLMSKSFARQIKELFDKIEAIRLQFFPADELMSKYKELLKEINNNDNKNKIMSLILFSNRIQQAWIHRLHAEKMEKAIRETPRLTKSLFNENKNQSKKEESKVELDPNLKSVIIK